MTKIGIFGGSGFYELFDEKEDKEIKTEYGQPSGNISIGKIEDKEVA